EAIVRGAQEAEGPIDPDAAVDPAYRDLREGLSPSLFLGYEREEGESVVVGLLAVDGDSGTATARERRRRIVDFADAGNAVEVGGGQTPFYAESGGQVGDIGTIRGEGGLVIDVRDTQKPLGGIIVHIGTVRSGRVRLGAHVRLEVDHAARSATRRNHSA